MNERNIYDTFPHVDPVRQDVSLYTVDSKLLQCSQEVDSFFQRIHGLSTTTTHFNSAFYPLQHVLHGCLPVPSSTDHLLSISYHSPDAQLLCTLIIHVTNFFFFLRCRVVVDNVGDHVMPEQSVFCRHDELGWAYVILQTCTQTVQILLSSVKTVKLTSEER